MFETDKAEVDPSGKTLHGLMKKHGVNAYDLEEHTGVSSERIISVLHSGTPLRPDEDRLLKMYFGADVGVRLELLDYLDEIDEKEDNETVPFSVLKNMSVVLGVIEKKDIRFPIVVSRNGNIIMAWKNEELVLDSSGNLSLVRTIENRKEEFVEDIEQMKRGTGHILFQLKTWCKTEPDEEVQT